MARSSIAWTVDEAGPSESYAERMLSRLLGISVATFEREHWLQKELFRKLTPEERAAAVSDRTHPVHVMPLADVKRLLFRRAPQPARWLHDVDCTAYREGKRVSLSSGGDGEVPAEKAWAAFRKKGFSLRMVHPQQYHQASFELCAKLQEYFGFPVGCSAYLTPAGSQGFPPHYDDCEVFVLQLEGSKLWRVYDRPDPSRVPRATTEFTAAQIGEARAELLLEPGDLLYLPRGVVHQAVTPAAEGAGHSLHLTFSTYQRHTWRDLLEHALRTCRARSAPLPQRMPPLALTPLSPSPRAARSAAWRHDARKFGGGLRALGAHRASARPPLLPDDGAAARGLAALRRAPHPASRAARPHARAVEGGAARLGHRRVGHAVPQGLAPAFRRARARRRRPRRAVPAVLDRRAAGRAERQQQA